MCTHNICFDKKYEKKKSTENCHFYSCESRCILHGRVFVMHYVNVSVRIKFSQRTSVFTLIIISSP